MVVRSIRAPVHPPAGGGGGVGWEVNAGMTALLSSSGIMGSATGVCVCVCV